MRPEYWIVLIILAFVAGVFWGRMVEALQWRSRGEDPPNGGGRMLSAGKFYWVCHEDADLKARTFVARTLLRSQEHGALDLAYTRYGNGALVFRCGEHQGAVGPCQEPRGYWYWSVHRGSVTLASGEAPTQHEASRLSLLWFPEPAVAYLDRFVMQRTTVPL